MDGYAGIQVTEFLEGDDPADAVMAPGIQEADMQRKANPKPAVMTGQHVQRVSEIVVIKATVPSPTRIRVGIMPRAAAAAFPIIWAAAYFMPVRAGMSMDAGPATGKSDAVGWDNAALYRRRHGCGAENLMEKLFIIKREFILGNSGISYNFCNAGMAVGQLFSFSRLICRLPVLIGRKKVFSAGFLELFILEP